MKNSEEKVTMEESLEMIFQDHYLSNVKKFINQDGIYQGKKEEIAKVIRQLSELCENYTWSIENIMSKDAQIKESQERKQFIDMAVKLEITSIISNF